MAVVVQERVAGRLVSVCIALGRCLVEILAAFNTEPTHFNMPSRTWLSTSLCMSPDSFQAMLGLASSCPFIFFKSLGLHYE